jgi:hypothetical protein
MAPRLAAARLVLLALAVAGAAAKAPDAAHLPASFDARDAFYGCADLVLDQARGPARTPLAPAARASKPKPKRW